MLHLYTLPIFLIRVCTLFFGTVAKGQDADPLFLYKLQPVLFKFARGLFFL